MTRPHREMLLVLLAGLALRAVYLAQLDDSPFSARLFLDSELYDSWAGRIASGTGGQTGRPWFVEPGYALVLAGFKLLGIPAGGVRLAQGLLGLATVWLISDLARRLGDRRAALVAGLVAATYLPFIYFEGLILKTTLEVFLSTLLLQTTLRLAAGPAVPAGLLGALAGAAGVVVRSSLLPVSVLCAAWTAWTLRRQRLTRWWIWPAILLAGPVASMGLMAARNFAVSGEPLPLPYNSGINFYIGNCAGCNGADPGYPFGRALAGTEEEDSKREAERRAGRPLTPAGSSAFWWRAAGAEIARAPGRWIGLLLTKLLLFWNRYELTDNLSIYFVQRTVPILGWPLPGFWLAAPLGLAGLGFAAARRDPGRALLASFILLQAALVVTFHVAERYRLAAVPAMIALGGAAVGSILSDRRTRVAVLAAGAAGGLLVSLPDPVHPSGQDLSNHEAMIVEAGAGAGGPREALGRLRRAVEVSPASPDAWYNLAVVQERAGELAQAESSLSEAIRLKPDLGEYHYLLGAVLEGAGRPREAGQAFERAAGLGHRRGEALVGAAAAYGRAGLYEQSESRARQALAEDPASARGWEVLGGALFQQGRAPEAAQAWRRSLELSPGNSRLEEFLRLKGLTN